MAEWYKLEMKNIKIIEGDITQASVDAIVNAANPKMLGGGGVDGAIHRAAGPALLEACRRTPSENGIRCAFGSAKATEAGELSAKYVIHAVGPIYRNEAEPDKVLSSTYMSVFRIAKELECRSLAIPAISFGAYAYPVDEAAEIAVNISAQNPSIDVRFYLREAKTISAWQQAMSSKSV